MGFQPIETATIMDKQAASHSLGTNSMCRFCEYLGQKQINTELNTPWAHDGRYSAMVSVGALVPGWSLVCPVVHSNNLTMHYKSSQFWEFVTKTHDALASVYNLNICIFEHGATSEESPTSCGTSHAHLHLVPLTFSLTQEVLGMSFDSSWESCFSREVSEISSNREYLFMADKVSGKNTTGYVSVLSKSTSQFFRRVIAKKLGIASFYNYKNYPMTEISEESAKILHALNCKDKKAVSV